MLLSQLHNSLANTMILFMLVCGVWGIFGALRGGVGGSFSGALVIGEGLILVQGLLGLLAYAGGGQPSRGLVHNLYGITAAMTLPAIYLILGRGKSERAQALLLGLGALFIVGLAIRGISTGQ